MENRALQGRLRRMDLQRLEIPEHQRKSGLREEISVQFEERISRQAPGGGVYIIEASGVQGRRGVGIAMDAGKADSTGSSSGFITRVKHPHFKLKLKEIRQIFYDQYGKYPVRMHIWLITGPFITADYKDIENTCLQHIAEHSPIYYSKQSVSRQISTTTRPEWAIKGVTCMGAGRQGAPVRAHLKSEQRALARHFQTMMGEL